MLVKLFIFFLLLLFIPSWYIYKYYIKRFALFWLNIVFWTPQLILTVGCVYIFSIYEPYPELLQLLSRFIIIYICFAIPLAVFMIVDLIMKGIYKLTRKRFYGGYIAAIIAIITLGSLIYGGTEGKKHFQYKDVTINFKNLPESFDGYKIVQISDIHTGSWTDKGKALKRAVEMVNSQNPDLIAFTGDLVNNVSYEVEPFMPILKNLKAKDGVYSVLGNHDYSPYIKWKNEALKIKNLEELESHEAEMGWRLLNNAHTILHRDNDSIALVGVENSGNPPFPDFGNLPQALKGTDNMFKVLLSHDPTHWEREVLPKSDVDLMLAGHTHDMQISLFGFSPSEFVYAQNAGLYTKFGRKLYVNIGLGYLMFPMRLGAWPEITVITLKRG